MIADTNQAINAQTAEFLAASLRQDNEFYARQLAAAAFFRQIFIFSNFGAPFQDFLLNPDGGLSGLVDALRQKLNSHQLRLLLDRAIKRQGDIRDLTSFADRQIDRRMKNRTRTLPRNELEAIILRAILEQKLKGSKQQHWILSEGGLDDLSADFRLLHDYHVGTHNREAQRLVTQYGELLLLPGEITELGRLPSVTDKDKSEWLTKTTLPRIRELWYFSVSLARLLQEKDFEFDAYDAYWLGLVNEVVGANLPCVRLFLDATRSAVPSSQT